MANTNDKKQVPYQHLAVLGMDKLKKYVPPPAEPVVKDRDSATAVDKKID